MSELVAYNRELAQLRATVAQLDTVDEAKDRAAGMTYRQIAKKARVTPMAVYLALNPEKRTPSPPKGERLTRPRSTRIALSDDELAALRARAKAEGLSMAGLVRAIIFGGASALGAGSNLEGE